jgi:hypothetical protein
VHGSVYYVDVAQNYQINREVPGPTGDTGPTGEEGQPDPGMYPYDLKSTSDPNAHGEWKIEDHTGTSTYWFNLNRIATNTGDGTGWIHFHRQDANEQWRTFALQAIVAGDVISLTKSATQYGRYEATGAPVFGGTFNCTIPVKVLTAEGQEINAGTSVHLANFKALPGEIGRSWTHQAMNSSWNGTFNSTSGSNTSVNSWFLSYLSRTPREGDAHTQYEPFNNSGTLKDAITKIFNNGNWINPGAVIGGDLLVDGSIKADALDVDDITSDAGWIGALEVNSLTAVEISADIITSGSLARVYGGNVVYISGYDDNFVYTPPTPAAIIANSTNWSILFTYPLLKDFGISVNVTAFMGGAGWVYADTAAFCIHAAGFLIDTANGTAGPPENAQQMHWNKWGGRVPASHWSSNFTYVNTTEVTQTIYFKQGMWVFNNAGAVLNSGYNYMIFKRSVVS